MQNTILNFALAVLVSLSILAPKNLFGQNQTHDAKEEISAVLQMQVDAWNHHDLERFMSGYWNSPDLTFFSGARESNGWQAALDRYQKTYTGEGREMGKLEFTNLRIEMLAPDAAFARGEFHLTMQNGKTPHGLFTLIFRKFPDGWKIVHDHSAGE
jgi:beta-aspartyl-peptidase (threonine type)